MLTKKNIRKARIASNRPLGKLKRLINPREREREIMGFFSSICCCLWIPSRVSSDGVGARNQPLMPNSIETEAQTAIVVPHFPVNSNLSRL